MDFERIIDRVKPNGIKTVAVAAAEDDAALKAAAAAYKMGIAVPLLCGDAAAIKGVADREGLDISAFEIVQAEASGAAKRAVALVREGKAQMLMKGSLQTSDLLRAVLDKEHGLRGNGVLSHVSILHSTILNRQILLTDAAIVMYPDLKTKIKLIENAVAAASGLGISCPKVAVLAAVEVINPDMPATLDAASLASMSRRGQIKGCVIDGPLAMDLALSEEAARHKGIDSPVAGKADILLFHTIEAANSALKVFTHAGNCLFGGAVIGASAPIILASRSDSDQSKLYSIACAASIAAA